MYSCYHLQQGFFCCVATGVAGGSVLLSDGSVVAFDYCLVTIGSGYAPPIKTGLSDQAQAHAMNT